MLEVFNNHYFVVLNNGQPTLSVHDTTPKWKLGKADWDKFKTLCSSKLKLNKNSETINGIASDFIKIFQTFCEETIPKTKPKCSKSKLHGGIKTVL